MREPRAWIVVGLGFGDCGKGTITDHLVRANGAALVIRTNGGAQAGHNVVLPDGRHHTFSQFGSGTFVPGVRTHLATAVVIHPSALLVEARHLAAAGVPDAIERLTVAEGCRVTTPFHQAAGRLRELGRERAAHGTCGVGVGETVRDALAHPADGLVARDLRGPDGPLLGKLDRIRERLLASLEAGARHAPGTRAGRERELLEDPSVAATWLALIADFRERVRIVPEEEALGDASRGDLVFEGAQGILLDERFGFHPHTTWSTCTSAGAQGWLADRALPHRATRLGVARTTLTRHGAGPLPSEDRSLIGALPEPHNASAGWQGRFRVGWPDPILLRYAIEANGGLDAIALTHVDRLAAVPRWRFVEAYPAPLEPSPHDLGRQAELTRRLLATRPTLGELAPHALARFPEWLEETLEVPIAILSRGPTFRDKEHRSEPHP